MTPTSSDEPVPGASTRPHGDAAPRNVRLLRPLLSRPPVVDYEAVPDGSGSGARFTSLSPRIVDLAGVDAASLCASADAWPALIELADRDRVAQERAFYFRIGRPYHAEYRIRTPDGRLRWLLDEATFSLDPAGGLVAHGSLLDITDDRRPTEVASVVDRQTATLLENGPLIRHLEGGSSELGANPALGTLLGYGPDEWNAARLVERRAPGARSHEAALPLGLLDRDGRTVEVRDGTVVILEPDGKSRTAPALTIGTAYDQAPGFDSSHRILAVLREVHLVLGASASVAEFLVGACVSLVRTGGFVAAWVGDPLERDERGLPALLAGATRPGCDCATVAGLGGAAALRALASGATATTPELACAACPDNVAEVAIMLRHGDARLGVLVVLAGSGDALSGPIRGALEQIAWELGLGVATLRTQIAEREASSALIVAETRRQALLDAMPDAMLLLDLAGVVVDVNAAAVVFAKDAGLDVLLGRRLADLGDAFEDLRRLATIVGATNVPQAYADEFGTGERRRPCELRVMPAGRGEVLVIVRDRTAARRAEIAARAMETRYRAAGGAPREGVLVVDPDGRSLTWNAVTSEILGLADSEPAGWRLGTDARWRIFDEQGGRLDGLAASGAIVELRRADAESAWLAVSRRELHDETSGGGVAVALSIHDVTDQRRLEERIIAAARMEAVGRLASGVAHGFANDLTAIKGSIALLRRRACADEAAERHLARIDTAADGAARVAGALLAFTRTARHQPGPVDASEIVAEAEILVRRIVGDGVDLVVVPGPAVSVRIDAASLQQVLLVLAARAHEALAGAGSVTIICDERTLARPLFHRHGALPPGRYGRIQITDTGVPLAQAAADGLLAPAFVAAAEAGLGLAAAAAIVRRSGGDLVVESSRQTGTTFAIWLPVATRVAVVDEKGTGSVPRILLVEDNPGVRDFIEQLLTEEGHAVVAVSDGETALQVAAREPISLLVTDIVMPRMNGRQLAQSLRSLVSDRLPVLFTSGYASSVFADMTAPPEGSRFLAKPFDPDELCATVRELLAQVALDGAVA